MDLISYAELAVRLVNTAANGEEGGDSIATLDGLQSLIADLMHAGDRVTRRDLDAIRALRAEFRRIFVACAAGNGAEAVERLNALLVQHPVHPQISGHDGQPWHLHLTQGGSVADQYAAGAAMGVAAHLSQAGTGRFGTCQAGSCPGVFIDTSSNGSRRYCSERCASHASVATLGERGRADGAAVIAPAG